MPIDFNAWLADADNDERRVLLVDVKAYSAGSEVTRYLSTHPAENAGPYLPVLTGFPVFEERMAPVWLGDPGDSAVTLAAGELEIDNTEGDFDTWLTDGWGGREIVLRLGDRDWEKADFGIVLTGRVDRLVPAGDASLVLHIRDRLLELDRPIQENTVDDGENGDTLIPLCWGECFHVSPVLVDDTTHQYQVNDGPIEAIVAVYENGKTTALTVTPNLSAGTFTLSDKPSGALTVDVKGAKPSGVWLTKPGEIVRDIVTRIGGFADPGDLDTASFTALDASAPAIGLYIDGRRNLLDVVDEILRSVRGYYGITPAGLFEVGQFAAPTAGESVLTLQEADQQTTGDLLIDRDGDEPPRWKTTLGYGRAWTTLRDPDASVTEADRQWLKDGWRRVEVEDAASATIKATHLDATAPVLEETLIVSKADATTEAAARQALRNSPRFLASIGAFAAPYQVRVGQVITLVDDRFGFDAGKPIRVVATTKHLGNTEIGIEGWY